MIATKKSQSGSLKVKQPINFSSKEFTENKYEYYKLLREDYPVCKGKVSILKGYFISRYDDCVNFLKDPRFVRNRTTATGGGRFPFPIPKSVSLMAQSMITEDEPEHRRLRDLVHQAFTRHSLAKLEERIEQLTNELLNQAEKQGTVDLKTAYALPIPITVIQEMVGVEEEDMPHFYESVKGVTEKFSGWTVLRALFRELPNLSKFVREMIQHKRSNPQEDILTKLIQAETEGEKLSEDELVSMVLLLVAAGYETTVYLIINSILTLLQHPDQLALLRAEPTLINSAVEEILRYRGPVHSTKPAYALEDVVLHGVKIPKGATVFPLLGAANHDSAVFENPEIFDIRRSPNKHLGFSSGIHTCLGAPLARMETKIAITNLLKRNPNLRLAVDPSELELINIPLWHRYKSLPVVLG